MLPTYRICVLLPSSGWKHVACWVVVYMHHSIDHNGHAGSKAWTVFTHSNTEIVAWMSVRVSNQLRAFLWTTVWNIPAFLKYPLALSSLHVKNERLVLLHMCSWHQQSAHGAVTSRSSNSISICVPDSTRGRHFHSKSKSHCDWQSISRSWCRIHYCLTVTILFLRGALSDERTGMSFVYAAGPCQPSLSRVRVPWDSRPYFTLSDLRLPFSSPPTTRRVTVDVFDPASTRDQTSPGIPPYFYTLSIRGYFSGEKVTEAWNRPLILSSNLRIHGVIPPCPPVSSWRNAQLRILRFLLLLYEQKKRNDG
jgi:hypothetical protein